MRRTALFCAFSAFVFATVPTLAQTCTNTKLTMPNGSLFNPAHVNKYDTVVGSYYDLNLAMTQGVGWNGGHAQTHSYPGSVATIFRGINDAGAIVGQYSVYDPRYPNQKIARTHGFELYQGQYISIDAPGTQPSGFTSVSSINSSGTIAGDFAYSGKTHSHGFIKTADSWKVIDYPNSTATHITGINDAGEVVGTFTITGGPGAETFTYLNGKYVVRNVPKMTDTAGSDINKWGTIVGAAADNTYYDTGGAPTVGFTYKGGNYWLTSLADSGGSTSFTGINRLGDRAGFVTSTDPHTGDDTSYAFLRVCR